MNISLKLIRGTELRKLSRFPTNLAELSHQVQKLYGDQSFSFQYMNEEGAVVTITSDDDLLFALAIVEELRLPSLMIEVVNVEDAVDLSDTGSYEHLSEEGCPICAKLTFPCEECSLASSYIGLGEGYCMQVTSQNGQVVSGKPGTVVQTQWKLANTGKEAWPKGCYLKLAGDTLGIEETGSGETCVLHIPVFVPKRPGEVHFVGTVHSPKNMPFGESLKLTVQTEWNADLEAIVQMGFAPEEAVDAMNSVGGQIDLAISSILRK